MSDNTTKMTFEEKKNKKNMYIKIRNLFLEKKYKEVIKESEKFLELYENDISIRFMYSKALRCEERFEEAINNLNINLKYDSKDQHSLLSLYYLYYFLGMYKEAYNLLPRVYRIEQIHKKSIYITKQIIRKKLNLPFELNEFEKDNYVKNQIANYDEEKALNHINEHLLPVENQNQFQKYNSQFRDINIKYLMEVVKENIKNAKKVNSEEVLEIYYFGVSNIGFSNENICNHIKVVVIPDTNDIISIYPILNVEEKYTYPLNCDYDKLFKRQTKTKSLSRIDKFNKKYNM